MPVELKLFARVPALILLGAALGLGGCQCCEEGSNDAPATTITTATPTTASGAEGDEATTPAEAEVTWYDPTTWFRWLDGEKEPVRKAAAIPFDAYSTLGYQLQWTSFAAVQPGSTLEAVDIFDNVIIARDNRAAFTAISPRSGDIRWAQLQGYGLANFVGVVKASETILLIEEGQILPITADLGQAVLNSRGKPVVQTLGRVVRTEPLNVGGMLLFGTESGHVVAHVTRAGVTSWQYLIGGRVVAKPTLLRNGAAAVVSTNGDVVVLSPEVGSALGRARVFGAIETPAVAGVDRFFVVSRDQSVYAFDDQTCSPLWRVRTEAQLTSSPSFAEGKVFVQVPGTGLIALDASNGQQAWLNSKISGSVIGVRKGRVIVWDGARASVVEPLRGDIIATVDLPGLKELRVVPFVDGDLYALWNEGQISRFVTK